MHVRRLWSKWNKPTSVVCIHLYSLDPWWLRWYRICLQCGRPRFSPWVRKIPWRRKWQPASVFLPGEFHGQKSLAGYSPWDQKGSDKTEWLTLSLSHLFSIYLCIYLFTYLWNVKWKVKVKLLSRVWLFATPWTVAYQAPPSKGFSRQEYWSGLPFPFPGDLPDPGIEPGSPAL